MQKPCNPFIKLNSDEVTNVLLQERQKWKIFRLQQVRAQSRQKALTLLKAGNKEEERLKVLLKQQLEEDWLNDNERKLQSLEEEYAQSLLKFGEAHKKAETEKGAVENCIQRQIEVNKRAAERGKEAFRLLNKTKSEAEKKEDSFRLRKRSVLKKENRRANLVAKMPTPPRFKPQKKSPAKPKKVKFYEAGTFTTSSYVPSSIHVVKEDEKEEFDIDARDAAKRENEKLEVTRKLKLLKERENAKKVRERANIARKKDQTRKMYSQLMSQLREAEQNHQLSDFFQESDHSSKHVHPQIKEREAEKRVKEILQKEADAEIQKKEQHIWKKEMVSSETFHTEIGDMPSFRRHSFIQTPRLQTHPSVEYDSGPQLTDKSPSRRVEVGNESGGFQNVPTRDDDKVDLYSTTCVDSTAVDSELIHFKETVPIHKLPIVKEKFAMRKVPEQPTREFSSVLTESSRSESSVEEIRIKINNQGAPDGVASSSTEESPLLPSRCQQEISSSSSSTQYLKYPPFLQEKLKEKKRRGAEILAGNRVVPPSELPSSESTSSTSFWELPNYSSAGGEPQNQAMWENIRQIQENRRKIKKVIDELKRQPPKKDDEKLSVRDFQTFKTPPRIYKEPLKTDSSGERPRTKRQKFEEQKRFILKHYMQRLMSTKQDELNHVTASTVSGSGIEMSSERYLGKLIKENLTFPSFSPIGSPIFQSFIHDVDTIPTKLSSGSSDVSRVPVSGAVSIKKSVYTSSCVTQESSNGEMETQKEEILLRMLQLQKLKKRMIIQRQRALGCDAEEIQQLESTSSTEDSASVNAESSVVWSSATTYQTPPREDSTLSSKASSSTPVVSLLPQTIGIQRVQSPVSFQQHEPHRQVPTCEVTSTSGRISDDNGSVWEEPLSAPHLSRPLQSSTISENNHLGTSTGSYSVPPDEGARRASRKESPASSVVSLPDMTEILKNFGLDWAVSMIKKMDIAEEDQSTENSSQR